jgi:hypothetical protein
MIHSPESHYENQDNFSSLQQISREDRIHKLYDNTPHSLSRVCKQIIEIGVSTKSTPLDVIEDMVDAILLF